MQKLQNKVVLLIFFMLSMGISTAFAQIDSMDKRILLSHHFITPSDYQRDVKYLFSESENAFIKYNPVSLIFGGAMYAYQKVISPQISASCLYHPSCSRFSVELIRRYGLIKGIICSADRLTRCNKIAAQDISPIRIDEKTNKVTETTDVYHK